MWLAHAVSRRPVLTGIEKTAADSKPGTKQPSPRHVVEGHSQSFKFRPHPWSIQILQSGPLAGLFLGL